MRKLQSQMMFYFYDYLITFSSYIYSTRILLRLLLRATKPVLIRSHDMLDVILTSHLLLPRSKESQVYKRTSRLSLLTTICNDYHFRFKLTTNHCSRFCSSCWNYSSEQVSLSLPLKGNLIVTLRSDSRGLSNTCSFSCPRRT